MTGTKTRKHTPSDLIDDFVTQYAREYEFYAKCADISAERIRAKLSASAIRAIVTQRAKRPDRLKEKLYNRNSDKKYKSTEDIRKDIVDFAGVRVALYFPSDQEKLSQIIDQTHLVEDRKSFPDEGQKNLTKRFSGYHAIHFRARLSESPELEKRFCAQLIEIQVASLLMHAWAEVEHDLAYKPLSGDLQSEELMILDEINGLVLTGELALTRLSEAITRRVVSGQVAFHNKYDLASYVYKQLDKAGQASQSLPYMDRLWESYAAWDKLQREGFATKVREAADFDGSVGDKLERLRIAIYGTENSQLLPLSFVQFDKEWTVLGKPIERILNQAKIAEKISGPEKRRILKWYMARIIVSAFGREVNISSSKIGATSVSNLLSEIHHISQKKAVPLNQSERLGLTTAARVLRDKVALDVMSDTAYLKTKRLLEQSHLKFAQLELPFV